ncbi:MAG TPA: trigger factor [Candidatus Bipolaricaulota bacterium]
MQVQSKKTSPSTYTLTIEISEQAVSQKIEEVFRRVSQEAVVSGFRRGKVPRRLLELQLGKDFLDQEVQSALMEEAVPQALEQESLRPLSHPETRVVSYEAGKAFSFELDVEVLPEVQFPDLSQITVESEPDAAPTDGDVERILEDLKVQHATLLPKDKEQPAMLQDVAVVQLPHGQQREIMLTPESELSKQLVGHRAGETVQVKLEDQEFSLSLKALKRMEKPDLEELASVLGKDHQEALLVEIRSQLQERLDHERAQRTRYKVLDAVIAATQVPVPPRLKEEVIHHELDQLERSGRVGALDEADRASYAEGAEQRLQREVALESFKRQHIELKLTDEAFESLLEAEAKARSLNPVKFKALLEREKSLHRFRGQKEDERVLDYLMSHVQLTQPKPAAKAPIETKAQADEPAADQSAADKSARPKGGAKKAAPKAAAKAAPKKPAAKEGAKPAKAKAAPKAKATSKKEKPS